MEEYFKSRKFATKSKGAQEAHEAIRPTNLANFKVDGERNHQRLYELIWKTNHCFSNGRCSIRKNYC